jgi:large subunit ribosomal protein L18e
MNKTVAKTNPRIINLISVLKEASRTNESHVWREIAKRLESPNKNHAEVNISKINRYANEGETIIVPGKVLGTGVIEQPVKVAALQFSRSAEEKIGEAKGTCITIEELVRENPKGSRVRILR